MRFILILMVLSIGHASAQSYYKGLTPNTYKITINLPDYSVVTYANPVRGKVVPQANKYYYWVSSHEIHHTQGGFDGSLLNGTYTEFYPNRNLKEKGAFAAGLRSGEWLRWSKEGLLRERVNWRSGERNGTYSLYDTTGQLLETGTYRDGRLNGRITTFNKSGTASVIFYRNGEPVERTKAAGSLFDRLFRKKGSSE